MGENYVFGVATLLADRLVAIDTMVVAQTRALKGFIDTTTELTAHPPLANGAVRPTPSRMTPKRHFRITLADVFSRVVHRLRAHPRHEALSVHAARAHS